MKTTILLLLSLGTALALSSCNTVAGLGRDIQDGGRAIQGSAQ